MRKISKSILFFPSVTRRKILLFIGLILAATFFEGFGVAMLFPVVDFIEKGKDFGVLEDSSKMWFYIGKALDFVSLKKGLITLMSLVFGLLVLRQFFIYLKTIYSALITEGILADIRSAGFKWFVKADISFYDSRGVGELINILTSDGVRAGSGIFIFFNLISLSVIVIVYLGFLLVLSPGLTLFAMAIMAFVGVTLKSRITKSREIGVEVSEYNEKISSCIVDRLSGVRLLKLSVTEENEAELVKELSEKIKVNVYDLARIRAKMEALVDPMVVMAGLIILYLSAEVFHMTLAKTSIFIFVLLRLMPYTKDLLKSKQSLAGFSGSLFRVKDLLDKSLRANVITGGNKTDLKMKKGLRFENVAFRYSPTNGFALKDLNFFIPAAKMTALVGRSGAGKSTLADLIPRLRVPESGKITVDDVPIEDFRLRTLRRSIAFVSQEGFLFNDTIESNIRYCSPDAPQEEIIEAAKMAYAHQFIWEFADRYKTVVGERGVKLSGGQRQRIILARALLQKASIIILDEPTSSLDSESEHYIQKAMERLRTDQSITMIIIAHRLSTIRRADKIIVLDKGRVIECGSHGELMHEDAWYAEMVKIQTMA